MNCIHSCIFVACAAVIGQPSLSQAADIVLSGKVLGLNGSPLSNVVVSLSQTKLRTSTDRAGAWSLGPISNVNRTRQAAPVAPSAKHLILEDGRLRVQFSDRDLAGRYEVPPQNIMESKPISTRAFAAKDTLVYSWNGKVRLRDTVSIPLTGIIRTLDTALNGEFIYGYITDSRDSQSYRTITIGEQIWMAQSMNYAASGVCYQNNATYCSRFGRLYSWNDAMNTIQDSAVLTPQSICPSGWHIPSKSEWNTMIQAVGGEYLAGTALAWVGMKGTDIYGFRALPAGGRDPSGSYRESGYNAVFWSASEYNKSNAWKQELQVGSATIYTTYSNKDWGFSVRCLQDN